MAGSPEAEDIWGIKARRILECRMLESRHRREAARLLAEASWCRWMALGCPADRQGIMGLSLLDRPKRKKEADGQEG